ncbi:MAG TPA: S8 family serine peptidase [Arachnia sp.]|nr:S8 family serine peptidase [Arachnia sp.]
MKHRIGTAYLLLVGLIASLFLNALPAHAQTAGSYIIVFNESVDVRATVPAVAKAYGLQPGFTYEHALKGMSAQVPDGRLTALQHDPRVKYVEPDRQRTTNAQDTPTGIQRIFADTNPMVGINGVDDDRVDVDVAVIDTGIDFQHPDLNVSGGVNCTSSILRPTCVTGGDDDHYHGTHVAGSIGALDNDQYVVGVAPGARLWAVKVLNKRGSGYSSWIIAGIDWVAANANTIEVANMSLGGAGFSQSEHDAIQGAVNAGVAFAVAAGNEDDDANNYSPGGFDNVLSVSALADFNGLSGGGATATCRTDVDDTLADFSNWGPEVDIAAPGVCILSTYPLEKGGTGTISGTSMASPHVAGALALLASETNPTNAAGVYNLYSQVKSAGNYNWTDDSGDGIQEPLLDVSNTQVFAPTLVPGPGGVTNQPPTAGFTVGTSDLTASFTDNSTDTDGSITAWSWAFGDGGTSTVQNPDHTYAAGGTYTVTLTVTDNDGATDTTSASVTVTQPSTVDIQLTATARQVRTNKYADLTWTGGTSVSVDVYRDGAFVTTTPNDGVHTDKPPKTLTTATYKVCETGTTICSNEATVNWA